MQTKIPKQDHLATVTTAIIKMSTNNKCLSGGGEKGTILYASGLNGNSHRQQYKIVLKR